MTQPTQQHPQNPESSPPAPSAPTDQSSGQTPPQRRRGRGRAPQPLAPLEELPPVPAPAREDIFPSAAASPQQPAPPPPSTRRFRGGLWFVGLPTLAAVIYFGLLASDQYYATAQYAIRFPNTSGSATGGGGGGGLGGLAGSSPLAAASDMFILRDYLLSHQILRDLQPRIDVRAIYSRPQADWWVRLAPDVSEEELLEYWRGMVTVRYDITAGISHLGVRAFTAEDAKLVADQILGLGEALVNRLSDRAQTDRVGLAQRDVDSALARVRSTFDGLQDFQQAAGQVNPERFVLARSEIEARLGQEITRYETQLEQLRRELPDEAPNIRQLIKRLDIARRQLAAERERSTASPGESGDSASEVFTEFSKLKLESEFAAKAYDSALASLEQARMEAAKQDRYLEAFVTPQLPDAPEFPRRALNILFVAVGSFLVWSIGSLMIAAIREHL
jgi:capsular polysaccharide transport system permease protein